MLRHHTVRARLTVLAYHRIADHLGSGFIGYAGNASATPAEFAEQMAWVTERLHPITLTDLAAAVEGRGVLPRRPVLVTFDDGYRDNLTAALPVLERYGVPATVFLATDHIGSDLPFWWDRAAWALHAAPSQRVALPLLGEVEAASDRHSITRQWVQAAKQLPDVAMRSAVDALPRELGVSEKPGAFRGVALTWDDVAAMRGRGVTFEAHTCSHPILTRVDPITAASQVSRSVQRVAEATGDLGSSIAFAYPNGLRSDVDDAVEAAVAAAGIRLAFTLAPGPSRWDEVVRRPLRIRRVYLHHDDGIDRFVAKVSGLPRLLGTHAMSAGDQVRDAVGAAIASSRGEIVEWHGPTARDWSWHFRARARNAESALLIKVPRWEGIATLEAALAAGPQSATAAEYSALEQIRGAVSAANDSGLAAIVPVAYVPAVNAVVMEQLEATPLRARLGVGRGTRRRRRMVCRDRSMAWGVPPSRSRRASPVLCRSGEGPMGLFRG